MKRFYFLIYLVSVASSITKADTIFYDITFSSPEHAVGQAPVIGDSPTRPSLIVFGEPIVSHSIGSLQDQPLIFNTAGNQPNFYYDQIRLDMDRGNGFYYVAFDMVTQNLIGSANHFSILLDTPGASQIEFKNNGLCSLFGGVTFTYRDNELLHFEITIDIDQELASINVNGTEYYNGGYVIHGPLRFFRAVRFSLGLVNSDSSPDHTTNVGVDNIFVADHIPPLPCSCVAVGGEDQLVYVGPNCAAIVTLDGSGSYDSNDSELTYQWSWIINGELYTVHSVATNIELPIGEHMIQLVVNNGECDSEPDVVVVAVETLGEADLLVFPRRISRSGPLPMIYAYLRLPEWISKENIDIEEPLVLYPGEIHADRQYAIGKSPWKPKHTRVVAFFDKSLLLDAVADNGRAELKIVGYLKTDKSFCVKSSIWVIGQDIKCLLGFAYHWLRLDCVEPDWCNGFDADHSGVVDFADFALTDGCNIETLN